MYLNGNIYCQGYLNTVEDKNAIDKRTKVRSNEVKCLILLMFRGRGGELDVKFKDLTFHRVTAKFL